MAWVVGGMRYKACIVPLVAYCGVLTSFKIDVFMKNESFYNIVNNKKIFVVARSRIEKL